MVQRVIDITEGVAMVVTDLHGDWDVYMRYRARFLRLREQGKVHRLILCGDLIHGYGPVHTDRSLDLILDVIQLQETCGPDVVTVLLGNHELPHLYDFPLSRGDVDYTPRFEAALSAAGNGLRARLLDFLDGLPFCARTAAGVMINHPGASAAAAIPANVELLAAFDHSALIARAEAELAQYDREGLRRGYAKLANIDYDEQARYLLAVSGPDDPRYDHLVRQIVINPNDPDFGLLWDAFFTRNEHDSGEETYLNVLRQFLRVWSEGAPAPQQVLVSGHIPVSGGYRIVAERQLRLASWAHANPNEAGLYLLLDCAAPILEPADLIPDLWSVFAG